MNRIGNLIGTVMQKTTAFLKDANSRLPQSVREADFQWHFTNICIVVFLTSGLAQFRKYYKGDDDQRQMHLMLNEIVELEKENEKQNRIIIERIEEMARRNKESAEKLRTLEAAFLRNEDKLRTQIVQRWKKWPDDYFRQQ